MVQFLSLFQSSFRSAPDRFALAALMLHPWLLSNAPSVPESWPREKMKRKNTAKSAALRATFAPYWGNLVKQYEYLETTITYNFEPQ
jgi:hypothetical protein